MDKVLKFPFKIAWAIAILVCTCIDSYGQIEMNTAGRVGIGRAPYSTYELSTVDGFFSGTAHFSGASSIICELYGYGYRRIRPGSNNSNTLGASSYGFNNIYYYNLTNLSDRRQKENIRDIEGSLGKILLLKGVKYDWKLEIYPPELTRSQKEFIDKDRKNHLGFIAQDVNEVLPEVVNYDDSTDIYGVDYTKLIPVLVEGIKEQQVLIKSLQGEIEKLKNGKVDPLAQLSFTDPGVKQELELFQNSPNPFDKETRIGFTLSPETKQAAIFIYDLQGRQVMRIDLNERGESYVTIRSGELRAGRYLYTLIVDGQEVSTKKMILTD